MTPGRTFSTITSAPAAHFEDAREKGRVGEVRDNAALVAVDGLEVRRLAVRPYGGPQARVSSPVPDRCPARRRDGRPPDARWKG